MIEIRPWWDRLVRWVDTTFANTPPDSEPEIIREEFSRNKLNTLHLIRRKSPGAIGTWRLQYKYCPSGSLILMVDNLEEIQRWLDLQRRNAEELRNPYETSELERSLRRTGFEETTHRFGVQWLRHPEDGSCGIKLITVIDLNANLDTRVPFGSDKAAFQIALSLAREIMNFNRMPGLLWEDRLLKIHWEDRLSQALKKHFNLAQSPRIFKRK